jgi:GT2 family glycosyltransferase
MNKIASAKWPPVSVIVPCYNGMKFLSVCLPSLASLDYPDLEVLLIDDASSDATVQFIEKNYPQYRLIRHAENIGFSATLNEGFAASRGKYVFFVNQDTVHSSDYLKICVSRLEERPELAAVTGKVCKFDFDEVRQSKIIDSVGLIMLKNRRVLDLGQGEEDNGQYEEGREVFGISGQNPLYRRSALEEVLIPLGGRRGAAPQARPAGELFDRDLFMYKEDVDLAWRLRLAGWRAWYEPRARAWHGRATSAVPRLNSLDILANRRSMSRFQKYHSIKNRYLVMFKNEVFSVWLLHLPRIIFYDMLYFGYNLLFDFRVLGAYFAALGRLKALWPKRRWIMGHRRAGNREVRSWFK